MKKGIAVLLIGLGVTCTVLAQSPPIVHFTAEGEAALHVVINGFPILEDTTYGSSRPIGLHLVPEGNRLAMKGRLLNDGIDTLSVQTVISGGKEVVTYELRERSPLTVRVEVYQKGMMTGDEGAVVLYERAFTKEEKTFEIDTTFTLPEDWAGQFTFGRRYTDAPVIEDEDSLRDYALHLATLLERGDMQAFYQEFKPKLDDYARLADEDPAVYEKGFSNAAAGLREAGPRLDFARDDVELIAWAGGRVWEVSVAGQRALLEVRQEGGSSYIKVYVGLVDGVLRVIR